jgi:DNA-binding LacI/PurR family transcriptional regulator
MSDQQHPPNATPARQGIDTPAGQARLQMADIAQLAGLSVSTVSRALSGSKLISEATRKRVIELAQSLNYTINVGAQNLRRKQNRTISVVMSGCPMRPHDQSDPFLLSLVGGVAEALTACGYDMLLSRADADKADLAAQTYETGRASGLILIGHWTQHAQLNALATRGVPMVVWGEPAPGQRYATVSSDNEHGGMLATAHLIAQGARQIVFIGDTTLPEIGLRRHGHERALHAAGRLSDTALLCSVPCVHEDIEKAIEQLTTQRVAVDGLFAASDLMAISAISALRKQGKRVPEDVIVVGYDDIHLAAHLHPPLSSVRQPIAQASQALVESVLAQMAGHSPALPQRLATDLIVRGSCTR